MSNKGIYTALSGAMAQSQKLDTIANNLANVSTTAFKKDKQVFNEYLTANEKQPDVIQVPRIPASIESFHDMQGGDRGFVDSAGTYTDFTQGVLKPSGNPFDIGLEGKGFIEVLSPDGVRLTRNGAFKIDNDGRLVTKEGHLVLRSGTGQDPAQRAINLENRNITISYNGDIYAGGEFAASLSLVNVNEPDALQKVGNSTYSFKPNYQVQLQPVTGVQVHQGFLEGSNVNVVQEMTDMIAATRVFESTQRAIKAFDSMNGRLVNDVPKTS